MLFCWAFIHFCLFLQYKLVSSSSIVSSFECCPSLTEIIQPKGGVSKHARILELYHTNSSRQSFYQTSCREGVKGAKCRFISPKLKEYSTCVQKYSYVYAIVRHYGATKNTPWRLDYIRIRSGCSCEVQRPTYPVKYLPEYRTN